MKTYDLSMKISQRFDLSTGLRKKGKDRTRQAKSHQNGSISPIWEEAPLN